MPARGDCSKPCKYGNKPDCYCFQKGEPGSNYRKKAKKCPYGFDPEYPGYCASRPADGRYGSPVPTNAPLPTDVPPAAAAKETATALKELGGAAGAAALWKLRGGILILGVATYLTLAHFENDIIARKAAKFTEREVNRTQRTLKRALTEGELATLTAQYTAYIQQQGRIAEGKDFGWASWAGISAAKRARQFLDSI